MAAQMLEAQRRREREESRFREELDQMEQDCAQKIKETAAGFEQKLADLQAEVDKARSLLISFH